MDKTYVFIMTHLGSNCEFISKVLNQNPRVSATRTNLIYTRVIDINHLYDMSLYERQSNEYKMIFCDFLNYNYNLGCKDLLKLCKFIYIVRRPDATLEELVANEGYAPHHACDYYCFRLQRLAQFSKITGGLFLTWDDIASQKGFPLIEKYLSLKMTLHSRGDHLERKEYDPIPNSVVRKAEKAYDRYIKTIKRSVNLMRD